MQKSNVLTYKTRKQLEEQEQEALVEWFKLQYPKELLFKIPNDLIRHNLQAIKQIRGGMVSGIPDLFLAVARHGFAGMFIEMKRPATTTMKAGKLSKEQKKILEHLASRGYYCVLSYGWDMAREEIELYMSNDVSYEYGDDDDDDYED